MVPGGQDAGGRQSVEQLCDLVRGVPRKAGEDVHVDVVVDLVGGVRGQHERSQSHRGWCGMGQEQGHWSQSPVRGVAASTATRSLVQDRLIHKSHLQGRRLQVRQVEPIGVAQFLP
jgi:hypothetical protein